MKDRTPANNVSLSSGTYSPRNMASSLFKLGSWIQAAQNRVRGWGYRQATPLPEWIATSWKKPQQEQKHSAWRGVLDTSLRPKRAGFGQQLFVNRSLRASVSKLGDRYRLQPRQAQADFIWYSPNPLVEADTPRNGELYPHRKPFIEGRWTDWRRAAVSRPADDVPTRMDDIHLSPHEDATHSKSVINQREPHQILQKITQALTGKTRHKSAQVLVTSGPNRKLFQSKGSTTSHGIYEADQSAPVPAEIPPSGARLISRGEGATYSENAIDQRGSHQVLQKFTQALTGKTSYKPKQVLVVSRKSGGVFPSGDSNTSQGDSEFYWGTPENLVSSPSEARPLSASVPEEILQRANETKVLENATGESLIVLGAPPTRTRIPLITKVTQTLAKLAIRSRPSSVERLGELPSMPVGEDNPPNPRISPIEGRRHLDDPKLPKSSPSESSTDLPLKNLQLSLEQPSVQVPVWVRTKLARILKQEIPPVTLHRDASAARITRDLKAEAVTTGQHIFLSPQVGLLDKPRGLAVLAHEMVHVGQPRSKSDSTLKQESEERQAEAVEEYVFSAAKEEYKKPISALIPRPRRRIRQRLPLTYTNAPVRMAAEREDPPPTQLSEPRKTLPERAPAMNKVQETNVDDLTDQIYQRLLRRIRLESEQRGY